jgi:branched-chain amino acid transport system substrate-binding protein
MKKLVLPVLFAITIALSAAACTGKPYACTDPLGCVKIEPNEEIQIAALLTLSGPDAPYGIDALRGVQIALGDKGSLFGHKLSLIEQDDLCTEAGGIDGANKLAGNTQIVGVIGATCSSGSLPAAEILTAAGMVLISPSSTAPSLTDPAIHQAGFLRSIYNDKVQGKAVAEFAYHVLGLRTMATIHDGTAYSEQLQQTACENLEKFGGNCVAQIEITNGQDITPVLEQVFTLNPDILYYPVYTQDGVGITNGLQAAGVVNAALISSDGLISSDFIEQTFEASQGMYFSGPAPVEGSQAFIETYTARFGEKPIATYHLYGYDAALMLIYAIEKIGAMSGETVYIPRQALRDELYNLRGLKGQSGILTCSPTGDCATPDIQIFQVSRDEFLPIYP